MTRVPRACFLGALALLLVLTGCSGGDEEATPDWSALPAVEHPEPDMPQPRDQDEVWATLARLDPCALLDPKATPVKGFPRDLPHETRNPHSCELERPADLYDVTVRLGVELSSKERFTRQRVDLDGLVGYVARQPGDTMCRVAVPVSDLHAIEFTGDTSGKGCGVPTAFATTAARRLTDDPGSLTRAPGPSRRASCQLLADAIGPMPQNQSLRSGVDFTDSLDECGAWKGSAGRLGGTGAQLQPVAAETLLTIEYTAPIREFYQGYRGRFEQLRGTEVFVAKSGDCEVGWSGGAADSPHADADRVTQYRVREADCRKAKRAARGVMAALEQAPPRHDTIEPLTYTVYEPDTLAPGACVDLADQAVRECAPYVEADVPDEPVELIRHAEADANVDCAATIDAVRESYGDAMQPVTATGVGPVVLDEDNQPLPVRDCVFIEPTHQLVVAVRFSSAPLTREADDEIAGHPAATGTGDSSGTTKQKQRWVALDEADQRGHLWLSVTVQPHRRTGMYSDSPIDEGPLENLDALAAAITEQHLD